MIVFLSADRDVVQVVESASSWSQYYDFYIYKSLLLLFLNLFKSGFRSFDASITFLLNYCTL